MRLSGDFLTRLGMARALCHSVWRVSIQLAVQCGADTAQEDAGASADKAAPSWHSYFCHDRPSLPRSAVA